MSNLTLIRHGISKYNKLNKFTGWLDINLANDGIKEAKKIGLLFKKKKKIFDIAYTSLLIRAIKTCNIILEYSNQLWIPIIKTWYLNERHYGKLQNLNKNIANIIYGKKLIKLWRRSFEYKPPKDYKNLIIKDRRYKKNKNNLPNSENLKMTLKRVKFFFKKFIYKNLKKNKNILIVSHGNTIRAIIKLLEKINNNNIINLEISTCKPIIYKFNNNLKIIKKELLKNDNI